MDAKGYQDQYFSEIRGRIEFDRKKERSGLLDSIRGCMSTLGKGPKEGHTPEDLGFHRHINPNGRIGGWVEDTAYVSEDCFVESTCVVADEATVAGSSLKDFSIVAGCANVRRSEIERSQITGGRIKKIKVRGNLGMGLIICEGDISFCRLSTNLAILGGTISGGTVFIGGVDLIKDTSRGTTPIQSLVTGGYIHAGGGGGIDIQMLKMYGGEINGDSGNIVVGYNCRRDSVLYCYKGDVVTPENHRRGFQFNNRRMG